MSVGTTPIEPFAWVAIGAGWAVPSRFEAEIDDPDQPYAVQLNLRVLPSRGVEVLSAVLTVRDTTKPGSVSSTGLRQVRVDACARLAIEHVRVPRKADGNGFTVAGDPEGTSWGGHPTTAPGRGRQMDNDFLREVARVYRSAVASKSRAPVEAVRQELHGSRSSAGRWVSQARERGLLGEARGPVAGEIVRKKKGAR